MAYWNYRVVKIPHLVKTQHVGRYSFGIHEVFYHNDDSIHSYTREPVDVSAETLEELREVLEQMLSALDKPVLVDGEVEFSNIK